MIHLHRRVPRTLALLSVFLPSAAGRIRVEGRQVLVDGELLFLKGVNWNPIPAGSNQSHGGVQYRGFVESDSELMVAAGINALRTYEPLLDREVLDMLWKKHIYVINTVYVSASAELDGVRIAIDAVKDHPAILMWCIGNEWNYNQLYSNLAYDQAVDEVRRVSKMIKEYDRDHPVATVYGMMAPPDLIASLVDVDIWGLTVYTGIDFGNLFQLWAERTDKPMFLAEFGADAYDSLRHRVDEDAQAKATTVLAQQILANGVHQEGVCTGGFIFELADEWWKDGKGKADVHDVGGVAPGGGPYPDGIFNEEYWGIVKIDGTPRKAYRAYAEVVFPGDSVAIGERLDMLTSITPGHRLKACGASPVCTGLLGNCCPSSVGKLYDCCSEAARAHYSATAGPSALEPAAPETPQTPPQVVGPGDPVKTPPNKSVALAPWIPTAPQSGGAPGASPQSPPENCAFDQPVPCCLEGACGSCAGDQCCPSKAGSVTCPSASMALTSGCIHPKLYDCTGQTGIKAPSTSTLTVTITATTVTTRTTTTRATTTETPHRTTPRLRSSATAQAAPAFASAGVLVASATIGHPPQALRCIIASGSTDIWVPSEECASCRSKRPFQTERSSTFKPAVTQTSTGQHMRFVRASYGTGVIDGYVAGDDIDLGPLRVENQSFIVMADATFLPDRQWDGICGLGRRAGSQSGQSLYDRFREQGRRAVLALVPLGRSEVALVRGDADLTALIKQDTLVWVRAEPMNPQSPSPWLGPSSWVVAGSVGVRNTRPLSVRFVVDTSMGHALSVPSVHYRDFIDHLVPEDAFDGRCGVDPGAKEMVLCECSVASESGVSPLWIYLGSRLFQIKLSELLTKIGTDGTQDMCLLQVRVRSAAPQFTGALFSSEGPVGAQDPPAASASFSSGYQAAASPERGAGDPQTGFQGARRLQLLPRTALDQIVAISGPADDIWVLGGVFSERVITIFDFDKDQLGFAEPSAEVADESKAAGIAASLNSQDVRPASKSSFLADHVMAIAGFVLIGNAVVAAFLLQRKRGWSGFRSLLATRLPRAGAFSLFTRSRTRGASPLPTDDDPSKDDEE